MKRSLSLPAKYQNISPRQLNRRPLLSVRLRRALGFLSFSMTPINSTVFPRVAPIRPFRVSSLVMTCKRRSSSVFSDIYIHGRALMASRNRGHQGPLPDQVADGRDYSGHIVPNERDSTAITDEYSTRGCNWTYKGRVALCRIYLSEVAALGTMSLLRNGSVDLYSYA
jgi:hypothetical protein